MDWPFITASPVNDIVVVGGTGGLPSIAYIASAVNSQRPEGIIERARQVSGEDQGRGVNESGILVDEVAVGFGV